jgi:hypothetical protein
MTLVQEQAMTVQALLAALSRMPHDASVLAFDQHGAWNIVTAANPATVPREYDPEGEVIVIEYGRYMVLDTVPTQSLVDGELGDAAAELGED